MTEMQGLLRAGSGFAGGLVAGDSRGAVSKGHKLGPKTTVWKASDIQALIDRLGVVPENGGGK